MARSILRTSFVAPLTKARYLGDYEAIVTALDFGSLVGINTKSPGQETEVDDGTAFEVSKALEERSNQLARFLESGGVLVVKVQPASILWSRGRYPNSAVQVDSTAWLTAQVFPLLYLSIGHRGVEAFAGGTGRGIRIEELDHPFEALIRQAREYTARIAKEVFEAADTTLLATTLIGDPVAAEISVGKGVVFLVPSGVEDKDLDAALNKLLDARERNRQTWLLPEEADLVAQESAVRTEAREKVSSLVKRREALADLRVSVMKDDVNVARAVSYFENGTSSTRSIEAAMHDLYKLVDLLEDFFGGSEDKLASGLAVPKALFKHIKKLANQPHLDFRHAESGETLGADAAEVEQARLEARDLVQRFIEHCCNNELAKRAGNGGTSTGE